MTSARSDSLVRQQVEQPFRGGQIHSLHEIRICHVGVHQQHRAVDLRRNAQCEIQGHEALAFAGESARDHHAVAALDRRPRAALRILDDRALQDAKFVGDLGTLRFRRDVARLRQGNEVDFDHPAPSARLGRTPRLRRRRTRRCGNDRRGVREVYRLACLGGSFRGCNRLRHQRCGLVLGALTGNDRRRLHPGFSELLQTLRRPFDDAHRSALTIRAGPEW